MASSFADSALPILAAPNPSSRRDPVAASKRPKKPATPKRAGEASPAPTGKTQPNAITIRGSAEWKDWLERFAVHWRSRPTVTIDQVLAALAREEGFEEPPPRMSPIAGD